VLHNVTKIRECFEYFASLCSLMVTCFSFINVFINQQLHCKGHNSTNRLFDHANIVTYSTVGLIVICRLIVIDFEVSCGGFLGFYDVLCVLRNPFYLVPDKLITTRYKNSFVV